jgi:hypothetical protein
MTRKEKPKNFFLKTPIKFSRLTSRFSMNRYHLYSIDGKHIKEPNMPHQEEHQSSTASGTVERTGYTAGNSNYVR